MDFERLLCREVIKPEYKIRSATSEEVLKLKSLPFLKDTDERFQRYYMVAGGYAAWVAGRTTTYGDIDIFCSKHPESFVRQLMYEEEYPNFTVYSRGNYQFILWMFDRTLHTNADIFFSEILDSFDMDVCRVGYFRRNDSLKYYCIERTSEPKRRNLWKHSVTRFKKYSKRVKVPFSLFDLALNECLDIDTPGTVKLAKLLSFPNIVQ